MRIARTGTTALFIDFQEKLFPAMNDKDILLKNSILLLKGLTILDIPISFTQQYTRGLGETLESMSSLIPEFSPIEKIEFSSFGAEVYRNFLSLHESKTVIICGIEAHVCVLQTAVDLREAGYFPVVITDCITSRTESSKTGALERFRFENIMTSTFESILFELTRTSGAEEFRAISKLVK